MANETTSTTLTELINSEWINPVLQSYVREHLNATRFCWSQSLVGKGTATWAQPRLISDMGTVGDGGSSVATAFDGTEATALTDTTLETEEATVSVNEYGLSREISDTAMEDMVDGLQLLQVVAQDGARILATAREDDKIALYSSLTNSQSDTGNDIVLSDFRLGVAAIRNRGVRADAGMLVAVLSDTQVSDLEASVESTNAAAAVYADAANKSIRFEADPSNGLSDGRVMTLRGIPVYSSGLVDTVNTGADDAGAIFVRGDMPDKSFACFGEAIGRTFRLETARGAEGARARSTIVVMSERAGYGILHDSAGEQMIFDA